MLYFFTRTSKFWTEGECAAIVGCTAFSTFNSHKQTWSMNTLLVLLIWAVAATPGAYSQYSLSGGVPLGSRKSYPQLLE